MSEEDFSAEEEPYELTPQERRDVEADLEDLGKMHASFAPQGVKGVVIACQDCGQNHYYEWALLQDNLEHMLDTGEPRSSSRAGRSRSRNARGAGRRSTPGTSSVLGAAVSWARSACTKSCSTGGSRIVRSGRCSSAPGTTRSDAHPA